MSDDIVKLTPAALDRILAGVFGERHVCPFCRGGGVIKELLPEGVMLLTGCWVCGQRGFVRVIEED